MKRILFLLTAILLLSFAAVAQEDTTRITQWEDRVEHSADSDSYDSAVTTRILGESGLFGDSMWAGSFAIVALVFAFPVVIIFITFYFQYRNRQAKYRLAEKALAAGQPIPQDFVKASEEKSLMAKGIKNIFTGLGLFIFLWAITEMFAIGAIGLLIMFTGFAEVIIHQISNKNK